MCYDVDSRCLQSRSSLLPPPAVKGHFRFKTGWDDYRYPRDLHRVAVLENLKILLQRGDGKGLEVTAEATEAKRREALKHVTARCLPALTNESEAISTVSHES